MECDRERNSGVGIGYLPTYICVDACVDVEKKGRDEANKDTPSSK